MQLFRIIPWFAYLLVATIYIMLPRSGEESLLNLILWQPYLPSDRFMPLTVSDVLIISSILVLYVETLKATRTSNTSIIDHSLSLLVFIVYLLMFMLWSPFGNTTFLIMTVASMMDVVLGFTVTISAAKRDFNFGG